MYDLSRFALHPFLNHWLDESSSPPLIQTAICVIIESAKEVIVCQSRWEKISHITERKRG